MERSGLERYGMERSGMDGARPEGCAPCPRRHHSKRLKSGARFSLNAVIASRASGELSAR